MKKYLLVLAAALMATSAIAQVRPKSPIEKQTEYQTSKAKAIKAGKMNQVNNKVGSKSPVSSDDVEMYKGKGRSASDSLKGMGISLP